MQTAFLHVLLAQGAAMPPEWVHLVPAGTSRSVDGRGPFKLTDPHAVVAASMAHPEDLLIDENHSTDIAPRTGVAAPARGRIIAMEVRGDGIWGRVEWTATGARLMEERAYRGLSPVIETAKDGTVLRVLRAALTNTPALTELYQFTRQETGMDLAQLRKALNLPDTADEAAVLAAIAANTQAVAAHAQQLSAIATAAGLGAGSSPEALVSALQTRQAAGDPNALAQQVVTLQQQIGTMQQERARDRATAFVDAAIKQGKPIASLREHYITRHVADAAAVEKELNAMVSINAGGVPSVVLSAAGQPDADAPTETEKLLARKTGMDVKKLVAQRKKREAGGT